MAGGTERWLYQDDDENSVTVVMVGHDATLHINVLGDFRASGVPLKTESARQIAQKLLEWADEWESITW